MSVDWKKCGFPEPDQTWDLGDQYRDDAGKAAAELRMEDEVIHDDQVAVASYSYAAVWSGRAATKVDRDIALRFFRPKHLREFLYKNTIGAL